MPLEGPSLLASIIAPKWGGPRTPPRVGGQWVQSAPSLLCECSFPSGGLLAVRCGPGRPGLLHVPPAEEAKAEEQHPSPQTPRELHPELPSANTQPHKRQATPSGHHQAGGGVLERTAFVLRACYQERREKRSWGRFGPSFCRSQSKVQLCLASLCSAPGSSSISPQQGCGEGSGAPRGCPEAP